jgi:hypothetical protein
MSSIFRHQLFAHLWDKYTNSVPYYRQIFADRQLVLDHLAIIDLPTQRSGIPHLKKIFSALGMNQRGAGYLPDKKNDFVWVTEDGIEGTDVRKALLQPVLADFRVDELSNSTRKILSKYLNKGETFDYHSYSQLVNSAFKGNSEDRKKLFFITIEELNSKPWGSPTSKDYFAVKEENPLIAWVLLNGRKVNHFGVSIHLKPDYKSLREFNQRISHSNFAKLNNFAGEIKGSKDCGIEQSSTLGHEIEVECADDKIKVCDCFMEFVWRFPVKEKPQVWEDYFTGFIPKNADNVIKSIYN